MDPFGTLKFKLVGGGGHSYPGDFSDPLPPDRDWGDRDWGDRDWGHAGYFSTREAKSEHKIVLSS